MAKNRDNMEPLTIYKGPYCIPHNAILEGLIEDAIHQRKKFEPKERFGRAIMGGVWGTFRGKEGYWYYPNRHLESILYWALFHNIRDAELAKEGLRVQDIWDPITRHLLHTDHPTMRVAEQETRRIWKCTNILPFPTGRKMEGEFSDWAEYCEKPIEHSAGYCWIRSDRLRIGYRLAGKYYKSGEIPVPVSWRDCGDDQSFNICTSLRFYSSGEERFSYLHWVPLQQDAEREEAKLETLPAHYKVMQDNLVLTFITHIDGKSVEELGSHEDFLKTLRYVNKRWPNKLEQVRDSLISP